MRAPCVRCGNESAGHFIICGDCLQEYLVMTGQATAGQMTGATHKSETYGITSYYKRVVFRYLNHFDEEWQSLTNYLYWDREWLPAGPGFCARRLSVVR